MSPTNNDTGLRTTITRIVQNAVREGGGSLLDDFAQTYASDILAIPEIAEALRFVEGSPGFTATVQTAIAKG